MDEEILLFPALMALIGWFLWIWMKRFQTVRLERMKQLEIQHELVKKFSSANEFIDFVQSEQGRRIFISSESKPEIKAMRFLTSSVILILAGMALLIQGYLWKDYEDINFVNKMHDFYYWGSMAIAIGIGLIINAWITVRLAKKWNLFTDNK